MNLITGDSHSNLINFNNSIHILCSGGSAKGLNNPKSISQYGNNLINIIKNNNYSNLFFLFGGVDLDFCFIHKYLKNNDIDYKEFNLDVINNYLNFITNNFFNKSVIILSVGLPCLDDDNLKRIKDDYFTRYDHHNFSRNEHFNKIIDEYLLNSAF